MSSKPVCWPDGVFAIHHDTSKTSATMKQTSSTFVLQNFGEINLSLAGADVELMKWRYRGDALMSLGKLMRFEIIGDQQIQFTIKEFNGEWIGQRNKTAFAKLGLRSRTRHSTKLEFDF